MAGAGRDGGRGVARTALGVVLAVLAGLLAPVAVVATRVATLVGDTDVFVATYTPVLRSDAFRQVLSDRLVTGISEQIGVGDDSLLHAVVTRTVTDVVASDALASATTAGLRLAHAEMVSLLTGAPGGLQMVDGEVQLRLAPFVDAITARLSQAGVPFLDRLPQVQGGVTLVRVDPRLLPALQTGYRLLAATDTWLPWVALAMAAGAVWAWPRTRGALVGIGLSLVGGVLVVGVGWRMAMQALIHRLGDDLALVAGPIATATTAPVLAPLLALGIGGAVLAFLGAMTSPRPLG